MSDEPVEVDEEGEDGPAYVEPLGETVNPDGSITVADAEGNEIETRYPVGSEEREAQAEELRAEAEAAAEEDEE
jgi:hypothetical protein